MKNYLVLVGLGLGAALMYVLDPQQGNRRRAVARDKLTKAAHKTGKAVGATSRDVAHRATGLAASLHSRFFDEGAPDEVVEARVRARLGRVCSHPGAVQVSVREGVATLRGLVLRSEAGELVRAISSVRGVVRMDNRVEAHERSEHIAALQGESAHRARAENERRWAPTTRLMLGVAGGMLTTFGLVRRDKVGMLIGGVGIALLTRAASDTGFEQFAATINQYREHDESRGVSIPVKLGPAPGDAGRPRPFGGTTDRIH
jgi:hypothetical protein